MAELMNSSMTANDGEIIHDHLTCQGNGVYKDYAIANNTVVSNMNVGHNQAVTANHGFPVGRCASVYGYALPDGGIVPDLNSGIFTLEF